MLVEKNIQLKCKIDELQESLNTALSETEATTRELVLHKSSVEELTDKHSRALDLHSASEARIVEAETKLQEAIERLSQRDLEANDLLEKLNALEGQIKLYEEQVRETSAVSETRNAELEESLSKLNNLESFVEELQTKSAHFEEESRKLAEANIKLTEDVSTYESKLSDLEAKYSTAVVEKDETVEQLQAAKRTIEDLTQQHSSEGQKLQSQISSVMDENSLLNEVHHNTKKELQQVISNLEEQLKEQKAGEAALKSEVENLKAEVAEKPLLQNSLKELEEKLVKTEAQLQKEVESIKAAAAEREAELTSKLDDHAHKVHDRDLLNEQVTKLQSELQLAHATVSEKKEADSQKDLEREASLKHSLEELEAKNKEIALLDKQVKELEQKVQLADTKVTERGDGGSVAGLEVKSRDIGSIISTPSKRKSKKKSEATPAQTSSSSDIHTHTAEASPMTSVKFIVGVVGVAVVSVIISLILGKRY
ncbi:hypothetical protein ACFX2C_045994 [Malus domestica]